MKDTEDTLTKYGLPNFANYYSSLHRNQPETYSKITTNLSEFRKNFPAAAEKFDHEVKKARYLFKKFETQYFKSIEKNTNIIPSFKQFAIQHPELAETFWQKEGEYFDFLSNQENLPDINKACQNWTKERLESEKKEEEKRNRAHQSYIEDYQSLTIALKQINNVDLNEEEKNLFGNHRERIENIKINIKVEKTFIEQRDIEQRDKNLKHLLLIKGKIFPLKPNIEKIKLKNEAAIFDDGFGQMSQVAWLACSIVNEFHFALSSFVEAIPFVKNFTSVLNSIYSIIYGLEFSTENLSVRSAKIVGAISSITFTVLAVGLASTVPLALLLGSVAMDAIVQPWKLVNAIYDYMAGEGKQKADALLKKKDIFFQLLTGIKTTDEKRLTSILNNITLKHKNETEIKSYEEIKKRLELQKKLVLSDPIEMLLFPQKTRKEFYAEKLKNIQDQIDNCESGVSLCKTANENIMLALDTEEKAIFKLEEDMLKLTNEIIEKRHEIAKRAEYVLLVACYDSAAILIFLGVLAPVGIALLVTAALYQLFDVGFDINPVKWLGGKLFNHPFTPKTQYATSEEISNELALTEANKNHITIPPTPTKCRPGVTIIAKPSFLTSFSILNNVRNDKTENLPPGLNYEDPPSHDQPIHTTTLAR